LTSKNQVSEALDAITQTEGFILIRGPEFWEAVELSDSAQAGALAYRENSQSIPGNSLTPIQWEGMVYEDLPCWDISDPTKIIIPANVARARIQCTVNCTGTASRVMMQSFLNGVNSSGGAYGMPAMNTAMSGTGIANISGAWTPVTQGDVIEVHFYTNNNNGINKASLGIEFG
jgi:hypothetical protein